LARSASSSAERGLGSAEGPEGAAPASAAVAAARWRGKEPRRAAQDEVPVPTAAAARLGAEKLDFVAGADAEAVDTGRSLLSVERGGLGGAGESRSDSICAWAFGRFAGHGGFFSH
jgi:hypothetical protein